MKRSEMIQKVKKVFNDMDDQNALTDYGAEVILNQLEEAGLCPKPRYISSGCMHTMREMCNCQGSYETGWENETK